MEYNSIKRILYPTDFSEASQEALKYALFLAKSFSAHLLLLHLVEPVYTTAIAGDSLELVGQLESRIEEDAQKKLQEISNQVKYEKIEALVLRGRAFSGIIETTKEKTIDLIVMGTHGRSGLSHLLMGSTAEKVVRKSSCPVLTVKAKGK